MIDLIEGKIELTQFNNNPQTNRMNRLVGVKKMVRNLDVTYYVTSSEEFIRLKPAAPQYKTLKNGDFNFLTPRIKDQKDTIMTDGPATTVVLHI